MHAQRLRKGRTPFSTRTPLASTGAQRRIVADATPAGAPPRPKTSPRRRAAQSIAHELLPGEGRRGVRVGLGVEGVRRGRARMR